MAVFSIGKSEIKEIQNIERALGAMQKRFPQKWEKALHDAADIAQKYMARNFATSGREFGAQWPKLTPGTMRDRQRKGYKPAGPILVRRGQLRAGLIDKRAAGHKRSITAQGIVLESTTKTKSGLLLFPIHQAGTKHIPARKMVRDGSPPWISQRGWKEIEVRFFGMFIELRRTLEKV